MDVLVTGHIADDSVPCDDVILSIVLREDALPHAHGTCPTAIQPAVIICDHILGGGAVEVDSAHERATYHVSAQYRVRGHHRPDASELEKSGIRKMQHGHVSDEYWLPCKSREYSPVPFVRRAANWP